MNRQINHKTMRVVVGCIALLLAPAVYLLANGAEPLDSISASYWSDARDIFVGALIAVGFFLFAYNGAACKRDLEFVLSKLSCGFAICVALFPTSSAMVTDLPPAWTLKLTGIIGLQPVHIHYSAAVLLFVCLIAMMWFFSRRALRKGKLLRSRTYLVIACLMLGGIIIIGLIGWWLGWSNTLLLVEIWGLGFFGIGWLLAGSYKTEAALETAKPTD